MKSLLIGINAKYIHPCIAIYQLKANCETLVDLKEFTIKDEYNNILNNINEAINISDYQLIGFSCYLWNIEIVIKLADSIKQLFPNIKVLLGGPEVSYDALYFLTKYPFIDFIIKGEGEESFDLLTKCLFDTTSFYNVPNLYYKEESLVKYTYTKAPDLNKIKLATLDIKDYKNRISYVESNRGCPYNCSYCVASLEKKIRFFDQDKVKIILKTLMEEKVPIIKFLDRTFNANEDKMLEFLDFIDKLNINTIFQFEVVVERLSEKVINRINDMKIKCIRLEIGIQSIHEKVNNEVGRHQDFDKLKKNVLLLKDTNKVDLHLDLIAGLPYEDINLFKDSFNEVFKLRGKELQLGFLKFLRGTKMMELVDKHEYIYHDKAPYEIIQNKYLSIDDISYLHIVEKGLNNYYNNCDNLGNPRFNLFWDLIFNENIITDYFTLFYNLGHIKETNQLDLLYYNLNNYFINNDIYNEIHKALIVDYLKSYKIKPKRWWNESITKKERQEIYTKILNIDNNINTDININILYQNALVIKLPTSIILAIYKDNTNNVYIFDNC